MTEELIAEIRKRAEMFVAEFDDVPASGLHTLNDGVDRTPAQMLRLPAGVDGSAAGPGRALHLRTAGVGLLDAVGLAGGQVGAHQHGGALHLLPHEDPRLETPLNATERHRG